MPLDPNAYPRANLGSVTEEAVVEQKIPGQLREFFSVGSGSSESPGIMGSEGQVSKGQVVL